MLADLMPRGDGTFILKPRVSGADCDTWLTVLDASRALGVSRTALYGLIDGAVPYLVTRRPSPRKILVSLKSMQAFKRATANPNFWACAPARDTLLAQNRAALAALAAN
jgi:hypothetical protein